MELRVSLATLKFTLCAALPFVFCCPIQALLESIAETSSSNCDSSTAAGSISSSTDGSNGSASLPVNGSASSPGPHWEAGCVVNVNFPSAAVGPLAGLALTHQGTGCVFPKFLEITEPTGPHLAGEGRCSSSSRFQLVSVGVSHIALPGGCCKKLMHAARGFCSCER